MASSITEPIAQPKVLTPGIFGAPQPSQVRRGSIPQPVHSRLNHETVASKHVKVIPAFAYDPYNGKTKHQRIRSRRDARRLDAPDNIALAKRKIHNRPATNAVRSRLS